MLAHYDLGLFALFLVVATPVAMDSPRFSLPLFFVLVAMYILPLCCMAIYTRATTWLTPQVVCLVFYPFNPVSGLTSTFFAAVTRIRTWQLISGLRPLTFQA